MIYWLAVILVSFALGLLTARIQDRHWEKNKKKAARLKLAREYDQHRNDALNAEFEELRKNK